MGDITVGNIWATSLLVLAGLITGNLMAVKLIESVTLPIALERSFFQAIAVCVTAACIALRVRQ